MTAQPELLGYANYRCKGHEYARPLLTDHPATQTEQCYMGHGDALLISVDPVGSIVGNEQPARSA